MRTSGLADLPDARAPWPETSIGQNLQDTALGPSQQRAPGWHWGRAWWGPGKQHTALEVSLSFHFIAAGARCGPLWHVTRGIQTRRSSSIKKDTYSWVMASHESPVGTGNGHLSVFNTLVHPSALGAAPDCTGTKDAGVSECSTPLRAAESSRSER